MRWKSQDFDGRVSLESCLAHFELLAQAQGWTQQKRAVQLLTSLTGSAMEVLSQLTCAQRTSYTSVVAVLKRRYGHHYQAEVFRARFRTKFRAQGETLQQLAQDLEQLVWKAYPGAPEALTVVLLRDQFVDSLDDLHLKVYVKQARVGDLLEALARTLEFESCLKTSGRHGSNACKDVRARRSQVKDQNKKPLARQPRGECCNCR